jgi:glycine/D-amino acid oxidase-like deaminating enzyme
LTDTRGIPAGETGRVARRLPVDPGPSGWNEILPSRPAARELDEDITADWLVIGAGFAGLAAARRLRQLHPEDRVVVLEAKRVGEGPAGRNSGFMIDLPHDLNSDSYGGAAAVDRKQIRMNRRAIAFALDAARDYGLPDSAATPCGKHNAAATETGLGHLRDYAGHLDRLGEPYAWLDAEGMHELTGTRFYRAGLHTPGAVMLQPAAFVRGVAAGLSRAGVAIYENSPVKRLDTANGPLAETPRGQVSAGKAILAVNGHAESFGFFRHRLMHVFTYASMTRPLTAPEADVLGGAASWHLTSAEPMGTSVRRLPDGRIVVRSRFTYDPDMTVDEARLATVAREHDAAFQARFPMLPGVTMDYRWAGRLCVSMNGVPAFGEVAPGLFSAVCQNGLGTTKGTFAGFAAAEQASGLESENVADMLDHPAPQRLFPEPFMWLGANAYLRWQHRKARGE